MSEESLYITDPPIGLNLPGPQVEQDGTVTFRLWAPRAESVELVLPDAEIVISMRREDGDCFSLRTDRAEPGCRYLFRKDGVDYPDPASRSQPEGVHGPSQVVDFSQAVWTDDDFQPPAPEDLVIYELHVGTFTPEGTFAAATARLQEIAALGITAVEVMPIAEFAGSRNWGYDGVAPYAAESSYGGPLGFASFVNAAHKAGLAVILDVVFNHFGPEGNYSGQFGDYQTEKYHSPWGDAMNFDGAGSDQVRAFFLGCVYHWMNECHVDGFRIDAIHEIHDESAVPFLGELTRMVQEYSLTCNKCHVVIAESDLNDRRVVLPREAGGLGMDAAWTDDFHHAVHAFITGERNGYYADFGAADQIAQAIERGWCYSWDYSVARARHHGSDSKGLPTSRFVFCTQNHDQIGNRMLGERLSSIAGPDAERTTRALLLLLPYIPLLFMGQEYGEERPFLYFVDHQDSDLLAATREGRAREFAAFHRQGSPPDPGDEETRNRSVLSWSGAAGEYERTRHLLDVRRRFDCFHPAPVDEPQVIRAAATQSNLLVVHLGGATSCGLIVTNLADSPAEVVIGDVLEPAATNGETRDHRRVAQMMETVVSVGSQREPGSPIDLSEKIRLEPYELVAGLLPARSTPSDR